MCIGRDRLQPRGRVTAATAAAAASVASRSTRRNRPWTAREAGEEDRPAKDCAEAAELRPRVEQWLCPKQLRQPQHKGAARREGDLSPRRRRQRRVQRGGVRCGGRGGSGRLISPRWDADADGARTARREAQCEGRPLRERARLVGLEREVERAASPHEGARHQGLRDVDDGIAAGPSPAAVGALRRRWRPRAV